MQQTNWLNSSIKENFLREKYYESITPGNIGETDDDSDGLSSG